MPSFLHGVVENVVDYTIYEGVVYGRYIHLRVADGSLMPLFDMTELCLQLQIGKAYEMLAFVEVPAPLRVVTPEHPGDPSARWHGMILDLDWRIATSEPFALLSEIAYLDTPYALVQTPNGALLLYPKDILEVIPNPVAGETQVQWSSCRIDFGGARELSE